MRRLGKGVFDVVQRFSNNSVPKITDEEIVAIYLYSLSVGNYTVELIDAYADRHLREFFPKLAGSNAFRNRLNRLGSAMTELCRNLIEKSDQKFTEIELKWVVDSLPIIMAGPQRSNRAKVASELADKQYCASKDLYFYGVKLHIVGIIRTNIIPTPSFIGMAQASYNDHPVFEAISVELQDGKIFGDKLTEKKNTKKIWPKIKI